MLQGHEFTFADADPMFTGAGSTELQRFFNNQVIDRLQSPPLFLIFRVSGHHHMDVAVAGMTEHIAVHSLFSDGLTGKDRHFGIAGDGYGGIDNQCVLAGIGPVDSLPSVMAGPPEGFALMLIDSVVE